ncbi:unnamed protein product [Rhizophagus irregularis]|nr:unnamed protein product [Rhizophagus irregularis]
MFVNLKSLNTPEYLTLEFINKIKRDHELYGMTQDPKKNYMMVLNNKCAKLIMNEIHSSYGITQDPQTKNYMMVLSAHENAGNALEWIPYDKFYNIKYIAKGGFGKVNYEQDP